MKDYRSLLMLELCPLQQSIMMRTVNSVVYFCMLVMMKEKKREIQFKGNLIGEVLNMKEIVSDMLVELLHDEEELVMLVCCWELLSICELLPIWIDGFEVTTMN